MNILFITSTRAGDCVLSTGLLGHLIERHPGARFTIVCGPAAASLFGPMPGLERVIVVRKRALAGHWLALWRQVAGIRWDLVVDLRRSAIGWLLRAGDRRRLPHAMIDEHRVVGLARTLDLEAPPAPRLWTDASHTEAARALLPPGGPVLALGPTANWAGKIWRAERFAELAARLTAPDGILPGARVLIVGGRAEEALAGPLIDAIPEARRTLGFQIDLLTMYALLARASLFVGNDSAPMHMAAAAGVPTLGLFGPSREAQYAPWGPAGAAARTPESYESIVGAPGYDHRTTGTLMDGLTVEAVEAAANVLWRRMAAARAPAPVSAPVPARQAGQGAA